MEPNYATNAVASAVASAAEGLPPLPEGEEIYDIMPAVKIPVALWPWALVILGFLLLAYYLYRRHKKRALQPEPAKPVVKECPRKVANRAVAQLLASAAYKDGNHKELCARMAQILKTYAQDMLEVGFGAGATSDEFMQALSAYRLNEATVSRCQSICRYGDGVLYRRVLGSKTEIDSLIKDLKYLIELDKW